MPQTQNEDLTLDPLDWSEFHALAREMIDTTVADLKGLESKTGWHPLGESDKNAFRTPLPQEGAGLRAAYEDFLRFAKPFPFGQNTRRFWGWAGGVGTADGVLASLLNAALHSPVRGATSNAERLNSFSNFRRVVSYGIRPAASRRKRHHYIR